MELRRWPGRGRRPRHLLLQPEVVRATLVASDLGRDLYHSVGGCQSDPGDRAGLHHLCHWYEGNSINVNVKQFIYISCRSGFIEQDEFYEVRII